MTELELAWCARCAQPTIVDVGEPCPWCRHKTTRRRGGWRRPDRQRFSRAELERIHRAHLAGVSLRAIARALYTRLGYASEGSCLETIRIALRREGFAIRSTSEATAASNRRRAEAAGLSTDPRNVAQRARRAAA